MKLEIVLLVLGGLLMPGALVAGLVRRSFLSLAALFVLAGFALGEGGLEVLEFDARSGFVHDLAVVALIVILFRDGLEVEAEMLQKAWHLPFRKLALAMPITGALVAVVAHWVVGLGWLESCLLGALLSPTDPVLSSSVVTNPRVPRLVRHSLNLESGLNDGLALPAVLAFTAALGADERLRVVGVRAPGRDARVRVRRRSAGRLEADAARRQLTDRSRATSSRSTRSASRSRSTASRSACRPRATASSRSSPARSRSGSCARTCARASRTAPRTSWRSSSSAIFVVFGALLTLDGLFTDGWAAVAVVAFTLLVARPVAIWIALAGTGIDTATKGFMAWFGPKGVATMTFSLLVLGEGIPDGERIFNLAALCVFASVLAHGLTDTPGSEWLIRREARPAPERQGTPRPPAGDAPA